jgi:hypothetical protein
MGLHDPFEHLKHKLWPKEKSGVKLPIWFPTTKSQEFLDLLVCRWRATFCWKALNQSYNFALDLILIEGLHTKLWAPKSHESQLWEFWDSHLGVLGQNAIWMLVRWLATEYTIKGKVVASPEFRLWWVLWIQVCSWFVIAPKVLQLCTNQLAFESIKELGNVSLPLLSTLWISSRVSTKTPSIQLKLV